MNLNEKQKRIVNEIHEFVKQEAVGFSEDDVFSNHILSVKNYAVKLAEIYDANVFIVTIAAYLHDIYHLQTKNHEVHEIEGAKFAKKFLEKYDLPKVEIELISKCILNHRGSKKQKRESTEEKIVSCADAMDHLKRISHMFYRKSEVMNYEEARDWAEKKIERGWEKMELPEAREMVRENYEAARKVFQFGG